MIHLLEISPEITPKQLKKLARRYAMTGGYEISLKEGLSAGDLETLAGMYRDEIGEYPQGSMVRRSSNAWRILSLISESELISPELKLQIHACLQPGG